MASGSEVPLCVKAFEQLAAEGIAARVVSMPCWELFEHQDVAYREPRSCRRTSRPGSRSSRRRPSAGSVTSATTGHMIGMQTFGASAPLKELQKKFGFTVENVVAKAKELVAQGGSRRPDPCRGLRPLRPGPACIPDADRHDQDRAIMTIAEKALEFVRDGSIIGLGTGHAASDFVRLLGQRVRGGLDVHGVATSRATEALAREVGVPLLGLGDVEAIDVTFDGADAVDPELDLIKGLGGALAPREDRRGLVSAGSSSSSARRS